MTVVQIQEQNGETMVIAQQRVVVEPKQDMEQNIVQTMVQTAGQPVKQ